MFVCVLELTVRVLGTVKEVREACNKARTDAGACRAAGLALGWTPAPKQDCSIAYNGP